MTKNILLRLFISVLLGFNVTLTISAQDENHGHSAAALQLIKGQRQWFDTQNAAGMVYDQTPNYSLLQFNYDQRVGISIVFTQPKSSNKLTFTRKVTSILVRFWHGESFVSHTKMKEMPVSMHP